MLKITDITHKICTYGPAIGHPVLVIAFEKVEEEGTVDALFDDFKAKLERWGLTAAYNRAINGKLETYILLEGDDIFMKDEIENYRGFLTKISTESALLQKDFLSQGKITVDRMRPPFFMWEGVPTQFTQVHNSEREAIPSSAYDDFNVPYAVLKRDSKYSPIALQQMMNNPFGTVFVRWEGEKSKDFIEEIRKTFNGFKTNILVDYKDKGKVFPWALENGYVTYVDAS